LLTNCCRAQLTLQDARVARPHNGADDQADDAEQRASGTGRNDPEQVHVSLLKKRANGTATFAVRAP
jgi:hypothetical protein